MKQPNYFARRKATRALKQVAQKEGVSLDHVRKSINEAITEARKSTDPAVQALWKEIPCAGEVPTPEELMIYVAERIKAMD